MHVDQKLINYLLEFGLTPHEASVYLAALSLGATTILRISKYSGVKRTTVYEVVNSLENKGLIKKEIHGFKTLYSAEHPEKLERTLELKRILLAKTLPLLESKYHLKGTQGSIKYYEGLVAIKNLYNDILKDLRPNDFYYAVSNTTEWQDSDDDYFMKNHVEKRVNMGLVIHLLFVDSPMAQKRKEFEHNFNEEIRLLSRNADIHVDMVITPHKLVTFQLHEPMVALVVENKTIINAQKALFEALWDKS